jgi:ribosomal protein S18 acetylase RimI-like enzyme
VTPSNPGSGAVLLVPLTEDQVGEVVDVMNRAFADYVVPMHLPVAALQAMIARDNIDLGQSYIARAADGTGLGVALTAVRREGDWVRSRVAAMGVAPEGRGQGLARRLLERQIADALARDSREIVLECFSNNTRALPLYESAGFRVRRRLVSYEAAVAGLRLASSAPVTLQPVAPADLPALAARCQDADPPWQLEAPTLATLNPATPARTVHLPDVPEPVGYLILGLPGGLDATEARLNHVGVLPEYRRRGVATAALAAWLAEHPAVARITIAPVLPEDMTALRGWLAGIGFAPGPLEQVEMARALD